MSIRISLRSALWLSLALLLLSGATATAQQEGSAPYRNPHLAIPDRVADLLSRMTLEEKVEQIAGGESKQFSVIDPTGTYTDETARQALARYEDPELVLEPKKATILRNGVQRYFREKNPAGHSAFIHGRSAARVHGVRKHQLSAGNRAGKHLGSGTGEASLHGCG